MRYSSLLEKDPLLFCYNYDTIKAPYNILISLKQLHTVMAQCKNGVLYCYNDITTGDATCNNVAIKNGAFMTSHSLLAVSYDFHIKSQVFTLKWCKHTKYDQL